jgi:hypothetical protein
MQYNDPISGGTGAGILQVCETLCYLGDTGITANSTLKSQFTNYINIAIGEIRDHILEVDKSWKADDYNYTNSPDAPITFVASQFDYELPVAATGLNLATLLRVNSVYYISGTEKIYLTPITNKENANATATGTPTAFYFDGKSIWFDIAPSSSFITSVTTFHVDFSRLDDPFVTGDTTQQPGFMGTYHHLVAYKASSLYLLGANPTLSERYSTGDMDRPGKFENGIKRLKLAYSRMNGAKRHVMTPARARGVSGNNHI